MRFRLTTVSLTVSAIVLSAVVVLIGGALIATSSSSFCSACHNMVAHVQTYDHSAHAGVNCEQCHTKPGPLYFLTSKLDDLQEPIAQLTGRYQTPIVGYVVNDSCRQCHTDAQLFHTITVNGIRVDHKQFIEAGFLCIRCHSTVAHDGSVPVGSQTLPSMDQCLLCHNNHYTTSTGQVATAQCNLCHARPPAGAEPVSHKNPAWPKRHGSIGILSTCSACHTAKNACSKCHNGVAMPHATDWIVQHGATVNARGSQICSQCHNTKVFCQTCHQIKMPHPANWLGQHPSVVARIGTNTCFTCHTVGNCQACHALHAAGVPPGHGLLKAAQTPVPVASPSSSSLAGQ